MTSAKAKKLQKKRRKLWSLLLIIMFVTALPRIASIAKLYEQKEVLLGEKQVLEDEQAELIAARDSMDDLETIERIAREKLGMIKAGERLMVERKE